tara:strand:- start:21 stop:656 length:636 start_codon:yes stop_codon:yes gene_type:complete
VKRIQAKYKRLLLELEFLYEDLEYHEEVQDEAKRGFQQAFLTHCASQNINYETDIIKEGVKDIKSSDPDSISFHDEDGANVDEDVKQLEKKGKPEEVSKIFKQIASKTHPDKFSNAEKTVQMTNKQVFLQAKEAAEESNYFKLQQIARRLGLDLPSPTPKQLKLMQEEARRIKSKVKGIQNTVAWMWYDLEDEEPRKNLMKRYFDSVVKQN